MRVTAGTSKIHADTFARALGATIDNDPVVSDDWIVWVGVDPAAKAKVEALRSGGQKVLAYWIGSDSMCALQDREYRKNVPEFDKHVCVHERIQKELYKWAIKSEVVYPCSRNFSFGLGKNEGRLVGVYMPEPTLYMYSECLEVARRHPDLQFVFYGSDSYGELPSNISTPGRLVPESTTNILDKISVMLRLCQHDGFPVGGIEAKQRNRHVIENYPYPGFLFASTLEEVDDYLNDPETHSGDFGPWGAWYREQCSPAKFAENMKKVLEK